MPLIASHECLLWKLKLKEILDYVFLLRIEAFEGKKGGNSTKRKVLTWQGVTNGFRQGSGFALIMSMVYWSFVKDDIGANRYVHMFADDGNIQRKIWNKSSGAEQKNYLTE